MTSSGLALQYSNPKTRNDFPAPTSNYLSSPGASPAFFAMAYQISPRFGTSAFIPPADVFADDRADAKQATAGFGRQDFVKRSSDVVGGDPVALHLLVETALGDSQNFDILAVEEVESLKQEQKVLDARLEATRRKLESETKIREATLSLSRLATNKANEQFKPSPNQEHDAHTYTGLDASTKKIEDLTRRLLETESRMSTIDMRLLMHTAAILQATHKGPMKRNDNTANTQDMFQRPDSPASLNTYDFRGANGKRDSAFDERSLYRSPENLDGLMNVLQNGTLHHASAMTDQVIASTATRLEETNERLKSLIDQANPSQRGPMPPPAPSDGSPDVSTIERQLDFLDQSLRSLSAGQVSVGSKSGQPPSDAEGRIEGINHQLYAILNGADPDGRDRIQPPPTVTVDGLVEQLSYMESSFSNLQQLQYTLKAQAAQRGGGYDEFDSEQLAKYQDALETLWRKILASEEEARERKRERRRILAANPDADEQLSPDEDFDSNPAFTLIGFTTKVEWLFRRAISLKDKQTILMRQIKQQRELNAKSDAQKEADFERLNEQVLSARSEKQTMERELERAIGQLEQVDPQAARETQERNSGLEAQLRDVQEKSVGLQEQLQAAERRNIELEKEVTDHQERSTALNVSSREVEERSAGHEAQVRDAQERAIALENKLREVQDDARVEAAAIQAELLESVEKMEQVSAALTKVTIEKETTEAQSLEATNNLNAKEEESRKLESEIVRLTTELTFAKAELDGAYGTRAQRAADSAANPTIKREMDELSDRNQAFRVELEALRKLQDAASQSEAEARQSERNLKAELSGMAAEYEALTRDAIQNEKDRDMLESQIDRLRDEKEIIERELSDEKVKWLGVRSPNMPNGGQIDMGATSIRMLREDFRKMMRDRTAEGIKALRTEQEERRKLEAVVRQLRKEANTPRSNLSQTTVKR